jgi:DNA-binding MarR family transcriptional regulator
MADSNRDDELAQLRGLMRSVLRGLHRRRRPTPELLALIDGEPRLGGRHVAVLSHVASEGPRTVGDLARGLGLSLPAASKLVRDLEDHHLLERREDPDDRRRTIVELGEPNAAHVRRWLHSRDGPLQQALEALTPAERAGFLKGLDALASALMEESRCGPVRSHHRTAHRRGAHRRRPL